MAGVSLVARDLACPVCNHSFKLHTPKSNVSVLERRDADFCPYFSGLNPMYYAVWVCPGCGYAALKDHFRELGESDRMALSTALAGVQEHQRHDFSTPERSLYSAMLSLQLADRCYRSRQTPLEIRAGIVLRLAWMCRYGNDRRREKGYLEEAIALYQAAYDHGLSRAAAITEAHVAFLIGEMLRRIGRGQEAVEWFLRAIQEDAARGETYRMAKDQLFEAKESIRFFEYLRNVEILKPLAIDEVAQLAAQIRNRAYAPGKPVCSQGEAGQSMFVLMRGRAEVVIDEGAIGTLQPGEVFGEMSLLTGRPRSATVLATEQSELLEIDRVAFRTVIRSNPAIASEIGRIVEARRHQNALRAQSAVRQPSAEQKSPEESGAGFMNRLMSFFELS